MQASRQPLQEKFPPIFFLIEKTPQHNKTFREVLMGITPEKKTGTTLFHTIDKQFKSDTIVNFQFHPEHASEAHNLIAGLVPFLKDTGHTYHLKMFTPEALNRQAKARWNATTREEDSETDMELANLLAEDDDLNFTDEPTMEKPTLEEKQDSPDSLVTMNIPSFPSEHIPCMAQDEDSISTFHPGQVVNLTEENESAKAAMQERTLNQTPPAGIFKTSKQQDPDVMSKMSMSDSASRISSMETELSSMHKNFKGAIEQLQSQA
jgi:hypothetical protein